MTVDDQSIGRNLAALRGDTSQKDLADGMRRLGWKWSQATVWAIERGDRALRLAEADDVSELLDVDLSSLLSGEADVSLEALARAEAGLRETNELWERYDDAGVALRAQWPVMRDALSGVEQHRKELERKSSKAAHRASVVARKLGAMIDSDPDQETAHGVD